MTYPHHAPKWVQAESVVGDSHYVDVVAYGETFAHRRVEWSNLAFDKTQSDVLVQNAQGDWLRIWFYDKDVQTNPFAANSTTGQIQAQTPQWR